MASIAPSGIRERNGVRAWAAVLGIAVAASAFRDAAPPAEPPPSIFWSTYLGGSHGPPGFGIDGAYDLALDPAGNAYVVGWTDSSDFPIRGGFDTVNGGTEGGTGDIFIVKFGRDGRIAWSSFLGGSAPGSNEQPADVQVDAEGSVYVSGMTDADDFPVSSAFNVTLPLAASTPFVAKISADGAALLWCDVFGADGRSTSAPSIALDAARNVYLAGTTDAWSFPTPDGFDTLPVSTAKGATQGYVMKLTPDGTDIAWASFVGGETPGDGCSGILVAADGAVLLSGVAFSSGLAVGDVHDSSFGGGDPESPCDGFVMKLVQAAGGVSVEWCSYLGGSGSESLSDIAADPSGDLCLAGSTTSADFPGVDGFDLGGAAFVAKMAKDGTALRWSARVGTSSHRMAVDGDGAIYLAGVTDVDGFPGSGGGFQPERAGSNDGLVVKVASDGASILWSSYLGGSAYETVSGIAANGGVVCICGDTVSSDFPVPNGFDKSLQGAVPYDGYVTLIAEATLLLGSGGLVFSVGEGQAADPQSSRLIAGGAGAAWTAGTTAPWLDVSPASGSLGPQEVGLLTIRVDPSALAFGTHTADVLVTDGAPGSPASVLPVTLNYLPAPVDPVVAPDDGGSGGLKRACLSSSAGSSGSLVLLLLAVLLLARRFALPIVVGLFAIVAPGSWAAQTPDDTWEPVIGHLDGNVPVPGLPELPGNGFAVTAAGPDTLYYLASHYLPGHDDRILYRFSLSQGLWTSIPLHELNPLFPGWSISPDTIYGFGMAYVEEEGGVGALYIATSPRYFWRYDLHQGLERLPDPPGYLGDYAVQCRVQDRMIGAEGRLFVVMHQSSSVAWLYTFDRDDGWQGPKAAPPGIITQYGDGFAMTYASFDRGLYVLPGYYRTELWRYDIAGDTWSSSTTSAALDPIPHAMVAPGSSLEAGLDGRLYCFPGYRSASTDDRRAFYRCDVLAAPGTRWSRMADTPDPIFGRTAIASVPGSPYVYAVRGIGFGDLWRYRMEEVEPSGPAMARQFTFDGAVAIDDGGVTVESGFLARATVSHPLGLQVRLEVEAKPVGQTFDGVGLVQGLLQASGQAAEARMDLAFGAWQWRARALSPGGLRSDWGTEVLVIEVRPNVAPDSTPAWQVLASTGAAVPPGARIMDPRGIRILAESRDRNFDAVRLEVEVRRLGEEFSGRATSSGGLVPSGGAAFVELPADAGEWRWQMRSVDQWGAAGAWSAFGGNAESEADFVVLPFGSLSGSACGGSATPAPAAWMLVASGILALTWRT